MMTPVRYTVWARRHAPVTIDALARSGAELVVREMLDLGRLERDASSRREVSMIDPDDELHDVMLNGRHFLVVANPHTKELEVEEIVVEDVPDEPEDEDLL